MEKLKKVRERLKELGIDGLLVTNASNRRYLTGFTGSSGFVLVSQTQAKFLTDFRYSDQAHEQVKDFDILVTAGSETLTHFLADAINKMELKNIGFEAAGINFDLYAQLKNHIDAEMIPTKKVIEDVRAVKTPEEIALIKKAAEIGDLTFQHILTLIKPGMTELELSVEMEYFMMKNGATSNSSAGIIIASGYRSAYPHGRASEKVIESGDIVTFDFGALYKGYRSDMTRTIALGEVNPKLKEIYQIVYDSLQLSLDTVKPGMLASEVDAIARDYITEKGYGQYFGHGGGHGIGLDIHEDPFFSKTSNQVVSPGMVVTIEPGIYIPNLGGVRIEDDVVITEDGIEILTHTTKELIVL